MVIVVYGVGLGILLALIGLATFLYAPRVGPNPFFGVRLGYTLASREVWDQANRLGGLLLVAMGLPHVLLGLLLAFLNVPPTTGILILAGFLLASLALGLLGLYRYARDLSRRQGIVIQALSLDVGWTGLGRLLLAFAVLAVLSVYTYAVLPAGQVATHFDLQGLPNGFMPREAAIGIPLLLGGVLVAVQAILVYAMRHAPGLVALPQTSLARWAVNPKAFFSAIAWGLTLGEAVLLFAVWDILWYARTGAHPVPIPLTIIAAILFALLLSPLLTLYLLAGSRSEQSR